MRASGRCLRFAQSLVAEVRSCNSAFESSSMHRSLQAADRSCSGNSQLVDACPPIQLSLQRSPVGRIHMSALNFEADATRAPPGSSRVLPVPTVPANLPERPVRTGLQPRAPVVKDTAAALLDQMNRIGTIYIVSTKNNTICTLVDMGGRVVATATAGSVGFKNARKSTTYAAQATGERIAEKAAEKGYSQVRLVIKGLGARKQQAVRAMAKTSIRILEIHEHTTIPHNGCRAPRRRRV